MIFEDMVSLWCEKSTEASVYGALPKDFYARLLSDIIGYTVSPLADTGKR